MIEIFDLNDKLNFMSYIAKCYSRDPSCVSWHHEHKPQLLEIGGAKDIDMEDDDNKSRIHCLFVPHGEFAFSSASMKKTFSIKIVEEGQPLSIAGHIPNVIHFLRIQIWNDNTDKTSDTSDVRAFLEAAMNFSDPPSVAKIQLYSSDSEGFWARHKGIHVQTLDNVFLPTQIKDDITGRVDKFLGMEPKYVKWGRPFKTSFLLTGPPGSGKTSLVKAIAYKHKMPLYCLNVTRSLSDDSAIRLVSKIKGKCILLLEDVDAFFVDRSSKDTSLTFSCILNLLDGVNSNVNGTIIFLTANNPQFLDAALLRVGRIDVIYNFGGPKRSEIKAAFDSMTLQNKQDKDKNDDEFEKFYGAIKTAHLSMCSIIDFIFHHETDYMEHIHELLQQQQIREAIINDKNMYT